MTNNIIPPVLKQGDTIGIVSPCDVKLPERVELCVEPLAALGFKVKFAANAFASSWKYAASVRERADDFNAMAADDSVSLVLFGGGEAGTEILPYIDYDLIASKPKRYCSFSDSTSILNAITSMSHIVTYYGMSPRIFDYLSDYNRTVFLNTVVRDGEYTRAGEWKVFNPGVAEGVVIGGYTQNFCLMLSSPYFSYDKNEKYFLILEDHECFSCAGAVARYLAHVEQSEFFNNVSALLFGHYSDTDESPVNEILARFAARHKIPVAKCNDFGHGGNNAVFPIGNRVKFVF